MYDYTDEKIEPQQSRSFYPYENIRMQALMLRDCMKFLRGENMASPFFFELFSLGTWDFIFV